MIYKCIHRSLYRYAKCVMVADSRFCVEGTKIFKLFLKHESLKKTALTFGPSAFSPQCIYVFRRISE